METEFYFTGPYYNLPCLLTQFVLFFRVSNSSFNFFIYYNMCTRYRETLRDIFRLCAEEEGDRRKGGH